MEGPPYAPQTATIGGTPNTNIDIPITSIFLALYLTFAAANMTILQTNQTRSHKFLISGPIFGFCMARTTTCTLRIVWAAYPHNVRIAMAAQILNNAGILIVYIVNLIFAQRVLRGKQPKIGWNPLLSRVFRICYVLIGGVLVMVITATVITYYTLDMQTKLACAGALKAAIVFLFFVTLAPLLLLAAAFFLLPRDENSEQAFGTRSMETKALVVFLIACLTITIAGFKLGTTFETPRPVADPAWYHSKAAFYSFGFVLEIVILCVVQIARVDRVFHVPDGSSAVKSYWAASQVDGKEMEASGRRESGDF